MKPENEQYLFLEPFRYPNLPFLYIVEDELIFKDIKNLLSEGHFGLETGFGDELSLLFNIDRNIPWIATESDPRWFLNFKNHVYENWKDMDLKTIHNVKPIIAVNSFSDIDLMDKAQTNVFRNIDYRDMGIISYQNLKPGHRMVFIVNDGHIGEITFYQRFLYNFGYEPAFLQPRSHREIPYTKLYPFSPNEFVLDITK
jgi:hypothetical protein